MSIIHKAFCFDCLAFDKDLQPLMELSLLVNDPTQLIAFIDSDYRDFIDTYEGVALNKVWKNLLVDFNDVHEIGDYALTRSYDPQRDFGIEDAWLTIDEILTPFELCALLGSTLGRESFFDRGKLGAYCQSP